MGFMRMWVCLVFVVGAGCSPGRMVGDPCTAAGDCPAMMCEDIGSGRPVCTQPCDAATPCPAPWVCGAGGACAVPCADGTVEGTGADRRICVADVFVACSTQDPIAQCASCGCEPFGGGVCIAGRGCVPPAPDGTACAVSEECASGVCYSDTLVCGAGRADGEVCGAASDCAIDSCLAEGVCGAPRAMGGACLVDADCETSNCSTNGLGTEAGVCLQTLGSPCRSADGTCQRCTNEDTILRIPGICFRNRCDPMRAATCPDFDGHRYACVESTMAGEYYCFEQCTPDFEGDRTTHDCYDSFDSCISGGSFCR